MKYLDIFESVINGLGVFTGLATIETILGIILLTISGVILLIRGIVALVKWIMKAKKDGKITPEELEELDSYVEKGQKEINEIISKKENLKK